jgi:hypothetical protein
MAKCIYVAAGHCLARPATLAGLGHGALQDDHGHDQRLATMLKQRLRCIHSWRLFKCISELPSLFYKF